MQSLRQIKNRIRSIENTKKVTSALQLVSVSKYNKLEKALNASRPYLAKLESLIARLAAVADADDHPLFEARPRVRCVALCVVTADSGLCGTYNNNIMRAAEKFIAERGKDKVRLIVVGRKGAGYYKNRRYDTAASFTGLNIKNVGSEASDLLNAVMKIFKEGRDVDEVYVLYTRFQNALVQKVVLERFLPVVIEKKSGLDCIYEPDAHAIVRGLIPRYISMKLRLMLLESFTSEQAARTVAMKMSTDNAKELLHGLILMRNKVRQARITQDIMEIVSSAEALKG